MYIKEDSDRVVNNLIKSIHKAMSQIIKIHEIEYIKVKINNFDGYQSPNIDIVEHIKSEPGTDNINSLSNNLTRLTDKLHILRSLYTNSSSKDDLSSYNDNEDSILEITNINNIASLKIYFTNYLKGLTEQVVNLIELYKTKENTDNSKSIMKSFSKVNKKIVTISSKLRNSNDINISSDYIYNDDTIENCANNLSDELQNLTRKIKKLTSAYKKKYVLTSETILPEIDIQMIHENSNKKVEEIVDIGTKRKNDMKVHLKEIDKKKRKMDIDLIENNISETEQTKNEIKTNEKKKRKNKEKLAEQDIEIVNEQFSLKKKPKIDILSDMEIENKINIPSESPIKKKKRKNKNSLFEYSINELKTEKEINHEMPVLDETLLKKKKNKHRSKEMLSESILVKSEINKTFNNTCNDSLEEIQNSVIETENSTNDLILNLESKVSSADVSSVRKKKHRNNSSVEKDYENEIVNKDIINDRTNIVEETLVQKKKDKHRMKEKQNTENLEENINHNIHNGVQNKNLNISSNLNEKKVLTKDSINSSLEPDKSPKRESDNNVQNKSPLKNKKKNILTIDSLLNNLVQQSKEKKKNDNEDMNNLQTGHEISTDETQISQFFQNSTFQEEDLSEDEDHLYMGLMTDRTALYDNEKFLNVQMLLDEAQDKNVFSPEIKQKLKELHIHITWELSVSHTIETRLVIGPNMLQKEALSQHNIKLGPFTKEEDNIIKNNWNKFCQEYDFENDARPFLIWQYEKEIFMPHEERKKFVQYIGQQLGHRMLSSIYRRFKILFQNFRKGRFSKDEDEIILTHAQNAKLNEAKFAPLVPILNRSRPSLEVRYKVLQENNSRKVEWNLKMNEDLLNNLMTILNVRNLEDLRNKEINNNVWKTIGKRMDISSVKIKLHWLVRLYTQLFALKPLCRLQIKIEVIEKLYEMKLEDWKTVDWQEVACYFNGMSSHFLWFLVKTAIRHNVPPQYHADMKKSIKHLYNVSMPKLKLRQTKYNSYIERLKLNENGKLEKFI